MRASQLARLLSSTIAARLPVLITGAPGIGKSDIIGQAAAAAQCDLLVSHPVVSDPTDAKGLPWAEQGAKEAVFLPFGDLALAINATKPLVWCLDDLGQATPAVQASYMQLLLARAINGHKLPEWVTFVAATNRRGDRAGVTGILEPVKSRFATIIELEANADDWLVWANANGIAPEVMAFLRLKPDALHEFSAAQDMKNSPSPRTWHSVSKLLLMGVHPSDEMAVYSGTIGEGRAAEFVGFLRVYRDLPSPDEVLLDPRNAPMPTESSALIAIATAMGRVANASNFANVLTYAERMPQEFGVYCVRDAMRRDRTLTKTKAWMSFVTGPLGRALAGDVA